MRLGRRGFLFAATAAACPEGRAAEPSIRVGTLRFGSVNWELDVIRANGLLRPGLIEEVEFASGPATQVALQAGRVDIIIQDWLWVARQRSNGTPLTLAPSSGAVGALLAPKGSTIRSVADLPGRRLGIAGSPIDKSWLVLQAFASKTLGIDLNDKVQKSFGPPPLLAQLLDAGRLDAVLTYWPFAAKAEAAGQISVITIEDAVAGLGITGSVPFLGFVFDERWAHRNSAALSGFLDAAAAARAILLSDDREWDRIKPLTGASSTAELTALRDWYRRGVPATQAVDQAKINRLYQTLARFGGEQLIGSGSILPDGTFWTG